MTKSQQCDMLFDPDMQPDAAQRILAKGNPAFQEAVAEIEALCRGFYGDFLRRHYKIGEKVLALDSDFHRYGDKAVKRLGKVLGWASETLYLDLHLAKAFSPEQIEIFSDTILPNGQPLSYSHLTMIASLTPDRRQSMLDMVLTEGLTVDELGEVMRGHNRKINPDSQRGRPLKAPKDYNGVVRQLGGYATDFLDRDTRVWSADEHSLTTKANDLSTDQVTVQRVEEVRKMAVDLRQVAIKASQRADEAEAVYQRFSAILKGKQSEPTRLVAVEPLKRGDIAMCDEALSLFGCDIIGELPSAPIPIAPELDPICIYQKRPIDALEHQSEVVSIPDLENNSADRASPLALSA